MKKWLRTCTKWADASLECQMGLCFLFIHSVVSNDSLMQADLGLCCLHMLEDRFPHGAAHIKLQII